MAQEKRRDVQEVQRQAAIVQKLNETGERERLRELVRTRLVECGWRDELKAYCKELIKSKGLEKITVDELVAEVTPRGKDTVPQAVKAELMENIRKFFLAHQE